MAAVGVLMMGVGVLLCWAAYRDIGPLSTATSVSKAAQSG